jgi:hypothetical protein
MLSSPADKGSKARALVCGGSQSVVKLSMIWMFARA